MVSTTLTILCVLAVVVFNNICASEDGISDNRNQIVEAVSTSKRSSGLLHDMFEIAVTQKIERIKLKKEVEETKKLCTDVLRKLEDKDSQLAALKKDLQNMDKENHKKIAFTAKVTGYTSVEVNGIIPYTKVNLNIGGGFNASDSTFYCPRDGVYQISASLETRNTRVISTILKNGHYIGRFIKGSSSVLWSMSSTTVAVPLRKGDKVNVRVQHKAHISEISFFSGIWISK